MRSAMALVLALATVSLACSGDDEQGESGTGASGGATGGGGSGTGGTTDTGGGSGGGPSGSGGDAGSGGSSGGSGTGGGPAGSGGATGGSAGTGIDTYQGGYVAITQSVVTVAGTEYASYSFSAGFTRSQATAGTGSCDISNDGPCRITDCSTPPGDAGTPDYETVSAGVIQLLGANQPLSLVPDSTGTYAVVTGQEKLWSGGENLTISAAGDVVPAFQEVLFAAMPVTLTSPSLPPAPAQATISTNAPLNVSWTGGSGGTVTVMLTRSVTAGSTDTVMLSCAFPAAGGAGTIPATAMAMLPKGPDGTFSVLGGDTKAIEPSGWAITVQEYVPAIAPEGSSASGLVTFN